MRWAYLFQDKTISDGSPESRVSDIRSALCFMFISGSAIKAVAVGLFVKKTESAITVDFVVDSWEFGRRMARLTYQNATHNFVRIGSFVLFFVQYFNIYVVDSASVLF